MPESVRDRPSSSHEYVFLLSKSKHYFYDNEAVKELSVYPNDNRKARANKEQKRFPTEKIAGVREGSATYAKRNLRSVWTINPTGYKGAHYAVFPPALIEPMILAGTSAKGCCPKCGSPWKRVISQQRSGKPLDWTGDTKNARFYLSDTNQLGPKIINRCITTGWIPTCDCSYTDTQPCLILDPFCGSGTTGMVAVKHGCDFIGLDLSKKYLHELAQKDLMEYK